MRIETCQVFSRTAPLSPAASSLTTQITAVGAGLATEDALDAEGRYLIPGLIDIHTHAAMGEDASDGQARGYCPVSVPLLRRPRRHLLSAPPP